MTKAPSLNQLIALLESDDVQQVETGFSNSSEGVDTILRLKDEVANRKVGLRKEIKDLYEEIEDRKLQLQLGDQMEVLIDSKLEELNRKISARLK